MGKGEKLTGGPYWTQNWIEAMWRFTAERFVDFDTGKVDFEALGREEYEFRKALFFRNFKNSPRAREAFKAAADDYFKKVANGQLGGRPRKSIKEDGDIREDSQANPDGSAITRNETRANDALEPSSTIYGDSESGDASEATTTISDNMRRVPQNEARESRRTEGHSLRVGNVARPSVRSHGRKFRNKEEFIQWAIDTGLDPVDANECWEATEERGGKDADGNTVKNIKAFARQWCKTRAEKRRTA